MGIFSRFKKKASTPTPVQGGWRFISEPFTGAWQRGQDRSDSEIGAFFAVFSCVSKIAQDISKLPLQLKQYKGGIWLDGDKRLVPFITRPNSYQSTQQFIENWLNSKLLTGNAYLLKERDQYGKTVGLVVLNPRRVIPMVDDVGQVYYQVDINPLGQKVQTTILPASEIIHDRWNCFYHPLVGLSPVVACAVAAGNGLSMQENSGSFFANDSRPNGILVAPGNLPSDIAKNLQEAWNSSYSGANRGKTAILSNGLTYQPISMSAADSQLIEQLKLSADIVCSTFKMPSFLIGFGSLPSALKVEDLNNLYYSSCLQSLIESIENLLTLETGSKKLSIEFDLESLIRMDSKTQMEVLTLGVGSAIYTPNEARAKLGMAQVEGGASPYLQQQNYSLSALAKRDAQDNPFTSNSPAPAKEPTQDDEAQDQEQDHGDNA